MSDNPRLQRTVQAPSRRAASASFHYAHAALRERAAAEPERYALCLIHRFVVLCIWLGLPFARGYGQALTIAIEQSGPVTVTPLDGNSPSRGSFRATSVR